MKFAEFCKRYINATNHHNRIEWKKSGKFVHAKLHEAILLCYKEGGQWYAIMHNRNAFSTKVAKAESLDRARFIATNLVQSYSAFMWPIKLELNVSRETLKIHYSESERPKATDTFNAWWHNNLSSFCRGEFQPMTHPVMMGTYGTAICEIHSKPRNWCGCEDDIY